MGDRFSPLHARQEKKAMIPLSFYRNPDVVAVAKALLGKVLLTRFHGELTGGIITETEAYAGEIDRASHAYKGRRTERTEVMYAEGGVAYVYLCYGIHHLLNIVTGEEGTPHAVLLRAIQPTHGIEIMQRRRKKKEGLAGGPGALTAALGVTLDHYGLSLNSSSLWIEEAATPEQIVAGPRIGVDYAGPDALLPYRFIYQHPLKN